MRKTGIIFTSIITLGLALAPVQLFAQGVGGTPLPPKPGDRAAPSAGVGGSAPPARLGQRVGSSGGVGGSALPYNPNAPNSSMTGNSGVTGAGVTGR
ncbi:hypothetical protein JQ615_33500 [Bradyrhizobium jicamae]|uniref:Uncharacterized protein n=1 Tax=Bradyrhizobium jicamae TaxID=280332 RepID=A0ABS5FU44_9BRAD|nr:hypothetical protein [Bradyrhizobium jicamae]MBR0800295.1 hypothetical protein [Bradyrhizobium jicamae]MBR0937933.1 hypothetical protein [Bradyrhizobium jicamae]